MAETTQQVTPPEKRNPTGKGGFGDHPENRSPGGWRPEVTFSYQYKRFIAMTNDQLQEYRLIEPMKHLVVEELAYNAVMRAKNSLADMKEITDRTEGKAAQSLDMTTNGKDVVMPILGGISNIDNIDDDIKDTEFYH